MTGTPQQLIDNLKRYKEAGLTLPLLWPPFKGVPTAKTIVDLRRLKEDILPTNVDKTMKAPVTAIVACDSKFYEQLPRLFPAARA